MCSNLNQIQINYKRRADLEGKNNNIVIKEIIQKHIRLINIYRWPNPQDNVNRKTKFQIDQQSKTF